jgi:choline dehydrogenase-like flavoprotein/nucleoside-diphosphate-sugar epimerase
VCYEFYLIEMRAVTQPEDLDSLDPKDELSCELCVVGAGPAGLAIARTMAQSGVSVLLLESGRLTADPAIDALNEIESDGESREMDQTKVRNRIFGGSTETWKGRCCAFEDTDFVEREWVPNSGWPIAKEEFDRFLDPAATVLGLGPNVYNGRLFDLAGLRTPVPPNPRMLESHFWQFAKNLEFPYGKPPSGPYHAGREFLRAPQQNVRVLVNATVCHVTTNAEGTAVESLEVSSLAGTRITVRPRVTVLCAGGVENARLLLASSRVQAAGVGNRHDNVGRYLMDHLRIEAGEFAAADTPAIEGRFQLYRIKGPAGQRVYLPGFVLAREFQRAEKLLHCAAWVEQVGGSEEDPWRAARSLMRRHNEQRWRDFKRVATQPRYMLRGLYRSVVGRRAFPHPGGKYVLITMVEQVPQRDSRITLASRRDALGMPLSKVHWKIDPRELKTMVRTAEVVADSFERIGLPAVRLFDWVRSRSLADAPVIDVAHPTGTTRMSRRPEDGVVDTNCRVHGVEGLYIAGSSVFPTAGHANPTLPIVALALRLADHLKSIFPRTANSRGGLDSMLFPQPAQQTDRSRGRVLVTGGTGNIGRPLVAELLRRGYGVRVVSSRANTEFPRVELHVMDWLNSLDFTSAVQGCDAVLHLGAELHDAAKMHRVNVDATQALVGAAEAAGVRFFGYTSTVSVYGSPQSLTVTEDTPVVGAPGVRYLTADYLRAYAETKLAGEVRLREVASRMTCTAFRPSVVVDADAIEGLRGWSRADRMRYVARRTNHVYVGDVVHAMIWLMERGLAGHRANGVEVFNIADESSALPTYGKLYAEAYRLTGDARFLGPSLSIPPVLDAMRDAVKYRSWALPPRYPLGLLRFSTAKLREAGFSHAFGLDAFYRRAIERLAAAERVPGGGPPT